MTYESPRHQRSRAPFRPPRAGLTAFVVVAVALAITALGAPVGGAATRITEPSGTYHVTFDAQGKPLPVTIVAKGFPPQTQIFVEQCNARKPSDPGWSPGIDCDDGGAPAPAISDAQGTARFPAGDRNHSFLPVMGTSPSNLFNCIAPDAAQPNNDLNTFTTCQIRVSTNNATATDDQVFATLVFGGSTSGSGSGSAIVVVLLVAVFVIALALGGYFWRRRRRPAQARVR